MCSLETAATCHNAHAIAIQVQRRRDAARHGDIPSRGLEERVVDYVSDEKFAERRDTGRAAV